MKHALRGFRGLLVPVRLRLVVVRVLQDFKQAMEGLEIAAFRSRLQRRFDTMIAERSVKK